MAVDTVTIHHEGAGSPSDEARGASGGYTYWIGSTRWEWLRSVYTSYATLHFNHVSLDICLSGNRMDYLVNDADIALIHGAFMDCHARGEVVDNPRVQFHRDNNGLYEFNGSIFSTVCPGDHAVARRAEIEAACRVAPVTPPSPPVDPKLTQWAERLQHTPLRFGMQGPDVAILVDELRKRHFLSRFVKGDKYGTVLKAGVKKFKIRHYDVLHNQDDRDFGPEAAIVLINS